MFALAPGIVIVTFFVVIALFRVSEMTFLPFILNFMRLKINGAERIWLKGVDSYTPFEIGYIPREDITFKNAPSKNHTETYDEIADKLKKI